MKKSISVLLCVIMLFSCMSFSSSAVDNMANNDISSSTVQLLKNFFQWFSLVIFGKDTNESEIQVSVEKEKIFDTIDTVSDVHASTILALPDGSLICAWFGGKEEGASDVRIWYSVKKDGSWSAVQKIADNIDLPHWNPVLDLKNDGTVRLYYKVGETTKVWTTRYCESSDGGATWSESVAVEPSSGLEAGGPVKNKCLRTADGLLLAPNSIETKDYWKAIIEYSEDDGETWQNNGFIVAKDAFGNDVDMIQPTLWQGDDGTVHALFRTKSNFIYKSDSTDGGKTWSEAYRTEISNNNSGIDCVKSENGLVWLVCNPVSITLFRSPLAVFVSDDDGKTFKHCATLERNIFLEYSYPSVVANGNELHICYTSGRKNIIYAYISY